jgi:hypothetical protein
MILNLENRMTTISIVHRDTPSLTCTSSIVAKADRLKPMVLTFQGTNKLQTAKSKYGRVVSLKGLRKKAGWDDDTLNTILTTII